MGPVTLAVLGAGLRGGTYAGFAEQYPDRARVVAVGAFAAAVASGDRSLIRTGPRESLASHLMAFAAERSRQTGAPVRLADEAARYA